MVPGGRAAENPAVDGYRLHEAEFERRWTSARPGIHFEYAPAEDLRIAQPGGEPFLNFVELERRRRSAEQRAGEAEQRMAQLEERLRGMGVDPDSI